MSVATRTSIRAWAGGGVLSSALGANHESTTDTGSGPEAMRAPSPVTMAVRSQRSWAAIASAVDTALVKTMVLWEGPDSPR